MSNTRDPRIIWRELLALSEQYWVLMLEFPTDSQEAAHILQESLSGSPAEKMLGLSVLHRMPVESVKSCLLELLRLSVSQKFGQAATHHIQRLPLDWLRQHVDEPLESILATADYIDYQMLLGLFSKLDSEIAERIARTAIHSPDDDIRELGRDYFHGHSGQ